MWINITYLSFLKLIEHEYHLNFLLLTLLLAKTKLSESKLAKTRLKKKYTDLLDSKSSKKQLPACAKCSVNASGIWRTLKLVKSGV